jgi:Ca2+-dependent lipid-binding protein
MSGTLKVRIVRANSLQDRDTIGHSDPYVIVVDPRKNEIFKTPTISNDLNPVWNEGTATFTWAVESTDGEMRFHVFDADDIGSDDFLGEGVIPVREMINTIVGERTLALGPRPVEPDGFIKKNATKLGTLTVSWQYAAAPRDQPGQSTSPTKSNPQIVDAERTTMPGSQDPHPAAMLQSGRDIFITVVKAVDLLNRSRFGKSDPYVLVENSAGAELIRTPVMESTVNPIFPRDKSTCFLPSGSTQESLHISVWDKQITADIFMGEAYLPVAEAVGRAVNGEAEIPLKLVARPSETDGEIVKNQSSLGAVVISIKVSQGS